MQPTSQRYSTIRNRYLNALDFPKLAVFRGQTCGDAAWLVVGPGLPWLGEGADTFEEALDLVRDRIRHNGTTE